MPRRGGDTDEDDDELTLTVSGETQPAPERYMTPKEILQAFDYDLDDYYLYPVDDIDTRDEPLPGDEEIDVADRNEFAAVAVDVGYGGAAAGDPRADLDNEVLETHIERLREEYDVDVDDDVEAQYTHVIVRDWEIPSDAYNKETTDVMIRVEQNYPNQAPDWVYVEEDLRLEGGSQLRKINTNQVPGWLALSWHIRELDGVEWVPYERDLIWYLETIVRGRLVQGD